MVRARPNHIGRYREAGHHQQRPRDLWSTRDSKEEGEGAVRVSPWCSRRHARRRPARSRGRCRGCATGRSRGPPPCVRGSRSRRARRRRPPSTRAAAGRRRRGTPRGSGEERETRAHRGGRGRVTKPANRAAAAPPEHKYESLEDTRWGRADGSPHDRQQKEARSGVAAERARRRARDPHRRTPRAAAFECSRGRLCLGHTQHHDTTTQTRCTTRPFRVTASHEENAEEESEEEDRSRRRR